MDWVEFGLSAAKAFAVVMFAMNVAVLLTWADRRQGAMIQDRVGPNRAVAWIPTKVAQALAVLPALGVAAALPAYVKLRGAELTGSAEVGAALAVSQLAIFWVWMTALVIAGRVARRGVRNSFDAFLAGLGDPRRIFYFGIGAHAVSLALGAYYRGTETGDALTSVGLYGGAAVFAFAVLFGAGYAAYSIRNEPRIGLRLVGLLHPAADGLKTLFKEDFIPPRADRLLHSLAPLIAFFPALVVLAVVPFGDTLCFGVDESGSIQLTELMPVVPATGVCTEGAVPLGVLDLNVGVLYFFALAGTGIVGAALAGWASDNKFSLLGGLRAASQMVSYEVTMGLTLIGAFMIYGTLQVDDMIRWQAENAWGIFVQPFAFVMFFAAAVAESKRIPFDLPEGESEIVAGYFTEYSGMKFAMFFFSEYIAVVTSSALIAAVFLGGWHLPFVNRAGIEIAIGETVFFSQQLPHLLVVLLGVVGFVGKTILLCWLQLTIRWTLPRFRYDQLMKLGWRKLLPASLVNILATGLLVLLVQNADPRVEKALGTAGDLTMALVAVAGLFAFVRFVLFLLEPPNKRRLLVTSTAQFAAAMGGTRTAARMQA
ncbi:MAG TPA: complex I subunit 1 family protein [Polyangiaceae bacterium]|nr:complex I subunit 1 family protein [Polyangiaceae bacterium]